MRCGTTNEQMAEEVLYPGHYMANGYAEDSIECIDAIRAALGEEGFKAYCRGNVIKYSWRAGRKGDGSVDMAKAAQYAAWAS